MQRLRRGGLRQVSVEAPVVLLAASGEIAAVNDAAARVEGLEPGWRLGALAALSRLLGPLCLARMGG